MNKHLVESANSRGYVVKSAGKWHDNQFGKSDIITIEGSTHRITFTSNVLHGVNYFYIYQVHDLAKDRVYKAHRYFHKFISLVSQINGDTFININNEKELVQ